MPWRRDASIPALRPATLLVWKLDMFPALPALVAWKMPSVGDVSSSAGQRGVHPCPAVPITSGHAGGS